MSKVTAGWLFFVAAIGMFFSMVSVDLVAMHNSWDGLKSPEFVGTTLGHLGAVIAAFVGGRLIPEDRSVDTKSRSTDKEVGQ